jgi:hypothetical protein
VTERKTYYNPMIDRDVQDRKMTEKMREAVRTEKYGQGGPLNAPDDSHPANLVSSLCDDGLHRPALDLDLSAQLVPSSTEGHFHLYIDSPGLTWPAYRRLLEALCEAGIIDDGYLAACIMRQQSLLRPQGVTK